MIADILGFCMMVLGLLAGIIAAASHTPYALAGAAMVMFVGAVLYHKHSDNYGG